MGHWAILTARTEMDATDAEDAIWQHTTGTRYAEEVTVESSIPKADDEYEFADGIIAIVEGRDDRETLERFLEANAKRVESAVITSVSDTTDEAVGKCYECRGGEAVAVDEFERKRDDESIEFDGFVARFHR